MSLALAKRRRPLPQVEVVDAPAPVGGINTIAAGRAMPDLDALYLYNAIASEQGLRARLGYAEWATNLTGAADNAVRTTLPFVGSQKNGSTNKLFASTSSGIWDVSASSSSPTQDVTFSNQGGDAGYGVACVYGTPGGRFMPFCDEENGLFIYPESAAVWAQAVSGTTVLWQASTAYEVGDMVVNGGNVYLCDTDGTSAGSGGPTGTGSNIADNTTQWDYVGPVTANAIGPSLADQRQGLAADPASFVFPVVWKNRLLFVEKDSTRAWYSEVNSIYGTYTSFDFGPRMRAGGDLRGLYNWSYDGGSGMDTLLVAISGAGDVVIYQGTDPSSASTFGLKGTWSVGSVPAGRTIATEYGGDLLILSGLSAIPLSQLVLGKSATDTTAYPTAKIANLFNTLMASYRTLRGWAIHIHPTDNCLLVTVPSNGAGQATNQLAMSFAVKGSWSQYRDLPIFSAGVWEGELYFGTADGRVCRNTGYTDNVPLDGSDTGDEVQVSFLYPYRNQDGRNKQIVNLRPTFLSGNPAVSYSVKAMYGFSLLEPDAPSGSGGGGEGAWDSAEWDDAVWGADYSATQGISGAAGQGKDVSIAVRFNSNARSTLVGVEAHFRRGGLL